MRTPRILRFAASLTLSALLAALTLRLSAADKLPAEAPPPSAAEIVELPTLSVTDTRELPQPEKWRYTQIPGFEVISDASDRETRRLLRDFETFRLALGIAWPMETPKTPPSAIILCGNPKSFGLFLKNREHPVDQGKASLLLNNREQAFILVDLALKTIDASAIASDTSSGQMELTYSIAGARDAEPADETSLDASTSFEVDHYQQLYREYIRYLFSQSAVPPPVWLEEGIAQIVMKMQFTPRLITFGKIAEATQTALPGASVEEQDFNLALRRRKLLSFEEFFGVTRDSETARNTIGNNVWAKQSYAFVHMCMYGLRGKYKKAFDAFVTRTSKTPPTEEIFTECFGKPYAKFLIELRSYIDFTDYKYQEYRIKGKESVDTPPPQMRDATEGEYTRIKGDAARLAGTTGAARDALVAAYIRGERDPRFLATLGQAELAVGNDARARKFLEAGGAKTLRPSVLVDLARLRLAEARANPAAPTKQLSAAQLAAVLKPLFVARALPPPNPDVYELIAAAWLAAEPVPTAEHLAPLTQGLKSFPRHAGLVYNTAALYARVGNTAAAQALVEHGEKIATNDDDRARFAQLKASLPRPAP